MCIRDSILTMRVASVIEITLSHPCISTFVWSNPDERRFFKVSGKINKFICICICNWIYYHTRLYNNSIKTSNWPFTMPYPQLIWFPRSPYWFVFCKVLVSSTYFFFFNIHLTWFTCTYCYDVTEQSTCLSTSREIQNVSVWRMCY